AGGGGPPRGQGPRRRAGRIFRRASSTGRSWWRASRGRSPPRRRIPRAAAPEARGRRPPSAAGRRSRSRAPPARRPRGGPGARHTPRRARRSAPSGPRPRRGPAPRRGSPSRRSPPGPRGRATPERPPRGPLDLAPQPSAVDGQEVTVDVVGCGRGQEHRRSAEVLRPPPPPGRDAGEDGRVAGRVLLQRAGEVGGDVAGGDRVDVDPERRPLVRERLGQLPDRAL